jgi:predicted glycosyltransferase
MINKETASTHKPNVLFYVQHLLGIRHLKRAATLSRAMEAAGLAVTIVSGRKTLPVVNIGSAQLVQLPPMRPKDESFSVMLDDYDHVLVHGDPDLVPFDKTFPLASRIADRLSYTGYIVDPPPNHKDANGIGTDEVIVSAGGGAPSELLFSAASDARSHTVFAKNIWRLLAGPSSPPAAYNRLQSKITDGVILERARPGFASMLANCALSISQGGYNTVMDILAARTRAVIAPYAGGKKTEQTLHARLLSVGNLFKIVWEQNLSAEKLANAINTAAAQAKPAPDGIATDGADRSANLLENLIGHEAGAAS